MSNSNARWAYAVLFVLMAMSSTFAAEKPVAIDSTLFTTYDTSSPFQSVSWIVCGSTAQSEGCYASGSMGTFGKVGALMEGSPSTNGSTVTRSIYVVDIASGSSGTAVTLNVFKKTDTISASSDTVRCDAVEVGYAAAGGWQHGQVFDGGERRVPVYWDGQSSEGIEVQKFGLKVTTLGIISGGVTAITADNYGYVTVTQTGGFAVYGPTGALFEDGGGAPFMLETIGAVLTSELPASEVRQTRQVVWRPKQSAGEGVQP